MAYQNLKTPLITKNGVSYNLQYESNTGNVQVISSDGTSSTGTLFSNGSFSSTGQTILNSAEQQSLYSEIQQSVRQAYTTGGGTSKGLILPPWAELSNQGNSPGQTSTTPIQSPSGNSGSTLPNAIAAIGDIFNAIANAGNTLNKLNNQNLYGYAGESDGNFLYPIDMKVNKQDVLLILKYRYNTPYGGLLSGGAPQAANIITSGFPRGNDTYIGDKIEPLGTVYLPMPNAVSDANSVSWGDENMNNLAASLATAAIGNPLLYAGAGGLGALASSVAGGGAGAGAKAGGLLTYLTEMINNKAISADSDIITLLAAMGSSQLIKSTTGVEVSPESILARGSGVVVNNNLELLFNGPTLRKFGFVYKMTARSKEEAATIRGILKFFKQGMAPKKLTGGGSATNFFLRTPNVFKLKYLANGSENKSVNKFKTCALESFTCNYTPDGLWAAYDEGQPVAVSMNMSFTELEPIYDVDYANLGDSVGF